MSRSARSSSSSCSCDDQVAARAYAELGEDVTEAELDRLGADVQLTRDLLVRHALRAVLREGDDPFRRGPGSEAVQERAIEALLVLTLRGRGRRMQATACGERGTEPCARTHRACPRPRQAGCAKAQGLVRGPPPPLIYLCPPAAT